jgi:hypothetical protein
MQVQPLALPLLASLPGSQYTCLDCQAVRVSAAVDDAVAVAFNATFADNHVSMTVTLCRVNHFAALSNQVKIDSNRI